MTTDDTHELVDLTHATRLEQAYGRPLAEILRAAYKASDGNVTEAARRLGVHRVTWYALIREAGLTPQRGLERKEIGT
jgi:transcriptional regulator of acetoin/glycerol metabolism